MKFLLPLLIVSCALPIQKVCAQNKIIDSLKEVLQTQKEDTNKVNTWASLSFMYRNMDADSGLYYGQHALALAQKLPWKTGMAKAYKCMGNNYYAMAASQKALECFQRSWKIYAELNNKTGIAESIGLTGKAYYSLSEYPRAL